MTIPAALTVKELADLLTTTPVEIIKRLMTHGVMAAMNDAIDYETAATVARELGGEPSPTTQGVAANGAQLRPDLLEEDIDHLVTRPPVVTILGHVDHGKTSLLDAIRQTRVTEGEAGGITQHIGAYQIPHGDGRITFIDTPGHAAFTAMRARGARVTDIAVLVVAANDGVMPQTIEAINHIKAANVPMIVAVNKIDLPSANPDRVKQQLLEHSVVVEEYGGDVVAVPVSATTREGLDNLLESITLVAELGELKANPARAAAGAVIEAELDTSRGAMATLLVQEGTLHRGDAIVVGETWGKIKAMFDDTGADVESAGPSTPVKVMGLSEVPPAGEPFIGADNEREARQLAETRKRAREASGSTEGRMTLELLASDGGTNKELILIVKSDVKGSAEAVKQSLEDLSNDEIQVRVIHSATGPVSDSDVMLAETAKAIVVAFNTRVEPGAQRRAEGSGVQIREYDIIYHAIEEIEAAIGGMREPVFREVITGHAEVRQIFKSSRLGQILGCYITDGKATRNSRVRLTRGGNVIASTRVESLRRLKDDVREVQTGFECGIVVNFDDAQEGDVIEFFTEERVN